MADPDELLVSFCEQSRVLGVASAAALYSDQRRRQTPEEREAEDASVARAGEAAAARAEGASSIPSDGARSQGVVLRIGLRLPRRAQVPARPQKGPSLPCGAGLVLRA